MQINIGGLEAGETPAEAAVREVWEETGLRVRAVRLPWEGGYGHGHNTTAEYSYLVKPESQSEEQQAISLGLDPEEDHLAADQRLLQAVDWVPLAGLTGDAQVARVLMALASEEVQNAR